MDVSSGPPTPTQTRRLALLAGLWLSVLLVLVLFRSAVLPFAGAAIIAYLVAPAVNRVHRIHFRGHPIPRWVALLLVYACFFLLAYAFFIALVPQLYRELARISRDLVQ